MNTLKVKIFSAGFFSKPSDVEVNAFASNPDIVLMGRGIDPQPNGSVFVFYRDRKPGETLGAEGKTEEAPRIASPEEEKTNLVKTLVEHRNEYAGNRLANEFNLRKYLAHEDRIKARIADCDARLEGKTGEEKHRVDNEKRELEKELKELTANRENIEKSIKDNDLHLVIIPEIISDIEEGRFVLKR